MKVLIVGAGIAGLSAAIGLRRAGHEILIIDKSSLSNEVGAAINVCPNAARILARWGFSTQRARFVIAKSGRFASGTDFKIIDELDFSHLEETYGANFFYSHRVDLHEELKLLATGPEGEGAPAKIRNKCEVVGYNADEGSVTLSTGEILTADLVIGADGVHSKAVKEVVGFENPTVPTGISCFRCLMPIQEIRDDPETASLMENIDGRFGIFISPEEAHLRVVWYPCRENEVLNVVVMIPDREYLDTTEGWNISVETSVMVNELTDFHPSIKAMLSKAKDAKLWKLLFRAPLPTWSKGRLVVIGDAAHPMLPNQGQAGAQAIEDGCALGLLFNPKNFDLKEPLTNTNTSAPEIQNTDMNTNTETSPQSSPTTSTSTENHSSSSLSSPTTTTSNSSEPTSPNTQKPLRWFESDNGVSQTTHPSKETLTTLLNAFGRVRRNRASAMQMFSNAGQDSVAQVKETARPYFNEGELVPSTPKELVDYNFRHDVAKACEEELGRMRSGAMRPTELSELEPGGCSGERWSRALDISKESN